MRRVLWGLSGSCTELGEFLAPTPYIPIPASPRRQANLASFSSAPFPLRTQPPVPLPLALPSPSLQCPLDRLHRCHRCHLCRPQRHFLRASKMQFEMHDNVKGKGGTTGWTGNPSSPWNLAASLPWAPWLRRQTAPACTPEAPEMRDPAPQAQKWRRQQHVLAPPTCGDHPSPDVQELPTPSSARRAGGSCKGTDWGVGAQM